MKNIKSTFLIVALLTSQCNYSGNYDRTAMLAEAGSNCEAWTVAPTLTSGFALGLSFWSRTPKNRQQKNVLNMMRLGFLVTGITSTLGAAIVNPCDSDRARLAGTNAAVYTLSATCGVILGAPITAISIMTRWPHGRTMEEQGDECCTLGDWTSWVKIAPVAHSGEKDQYDNV